MKTLTIRINAEDKELIKKYAKFNNISVSDLLRKSVIEKVEAVA